MDFKKYENKFKYNRASRDEYHAEDARLKELFKADMEKEEGVADNPKRDRLFEIAWDEGHSSGYEEVWNHYTTLVELIR